MPHLLDNLTAMTVAPELTDDEITALTEVEDENSAELQTMSERMVDALTDRASTR